MRTYWDRLFDADVAYRTAYSQLHQCVLAKPALDRGIYEEVRVVL